MLNDRAHSKHESDEGENKLLKEALQSAEEKIQKQKM